MSFFSSDGPALWATNLSYTPLPSRARWQLWHRLKRRRQTVRDCVLCSFVRFLYCFTDASLVPGNTLEIYSSTLKSKDGMYGPTTSSIVVAKPSVMKAPSVVISGPARVDVCSPVDLRALASSPRQVSYAWRCLNDNVADAFLRTIKDSFVYMPEGTPKLPTIEKTYRISLTVTDNFGTESEPYVFMLVKMRSPLPTIRLVPSTLTVFPDEEILIRAEATFSACPVPHTDLTFSWTQRSGPPIPEQYLMSANARLYIPRNILPSGAQIELISSVSMQDRSEVSNTFILRTGVKPLVASISGGSDRNFSAAVGFELSASGSFDPNVNVEKHSGLSFKWSCKVAEDSGVVPCRNASGGLLQLVPASSVRIEPNTLIPNEQKYMFSVTVSKLDRTSASAYVSVFVLPTVVPSLDIQILSGGILKGKTVFINPNLPTLSLNASSDVEGTSFQWVLSTAWQAASSAVAPSGLISHFIVLDGPFPQLVPGSRYIIQVLGRGANSTTGIASLEIHVNAPPSNGDFTACLNGALVSSCVSTGVAIVDTFRLQCNGWIDPDLPLTFIFGYNQASSNNSALPSTIYWWESTLDFARDAWLPSGTINTMVRIFDALGAETDVLSRTLAVAPVTIQTMGQRRLLTIESSFSAKVMAIVSDSLMASRADQVNQLAGAIAIESMQAITSQEGTSLRSDLMSALLSSTTKAIRTLAFSCEVFGSAVLVLNATELINEKSIQHAGTVIRTLVLDVSHLQAVPRSCALSLVTMMASTMQAQSSRSDILWTDSSLVPELTNRFVHLLNESEGITFLRSIERGSTELMTKVIWDDPAGGPERNVFANASRHTMARSKLVDLGSRIMKQSTPMYDSMLQPASVLFPASLAEHLPSISKEEVDVHLQSHSHAPAAKGLWIRSQLFGVTLALPRGGSLLNISNLSSPVKLYVPVHTYRMSEREKMLFTQQAQCVYWDNDRYKASGCNVTAVDGHKPSEAAWPRTLPLSLVTMEATHLTLFAVNQDYNAPACGDGIIQRTGGGIIQKLEQCDDSDIDSIDGCSSSCTVESGYECFLEPSVCVVRPATFGVQSKISLRGFSSAYDFSQYVDKFAVAVARTVGLGIQPRDVSVFKVCFRSESSCETYFDVWVDPEAARRRSELGRKQSELRASNSDSNKVIVYFQINAEQADSAFMKVLKMMRTYEYLPSLSSEFGNLIGRNTMDAEWVQSAVIVDPKYAPGWRDPAPAPPPWEPTEKALSQPARQDKAEYLLHDIAARLGVSMGVLIFLFVMMVIIVIGSIIVFRLQYNKKTEELEALKKVAPEPLLPSEPKVPPHSSGEFESAPLVVLQDGIEPVLPDAVLDSGFAGASSILPAETIAEVMEQEIKQPTIPVPPPPLPPGKMKR